MSPKQKAEFKKTALQARATGEIIVNEVAQEPARRRSFENEQQRKEHMQKMNLKRVQRYRLRHAGL